MIQYILISILIYVILVGVIVFLSYLLWNKNQKKIVETNNKIIEKEKIINEINKKSDNEIKEVENEIKNANSINDFVNIFSKL
jgi:F0F1-type ATP synthase membrane subunit b/b'